MERTKMLTFHHYQINEEISRGKESAIYRGAHLYSRKEVAIKIYDGSFLSGEEDLQRFKQWAERWMGLGNCGLVPLIEWGVSEGKPYLVMSLMSGRTVRDLLEASPMLPQSLILTIWVRVASALRALHAAGVCHGGLTPSAILLDDENRPYLSRGRFLLENPDRLVGGIYLEGTESLEELAYRDPARLRGAGIDPAGDWYGFAALMYELLAGQPIFTVRAKSDMISYQLNVPPLPLRDTVFGPNGRDLVMMGLAKEPEERPVDLLETYLTVTGFDRRVEVREAQEGLRIEVNHNELTHQGLSSWQVFDPEAEVGQTSEYNPDILTEPDQLLREQREARELQRAFLIFFGLVFLVTIGLLLLTYAGL